MRSDMRTHDQVVAKLMRRPRVRKEVERIEREEGALLDVLLKARHEAGLTQAQVAEREAHDDAFQTLYSARRSNPPGAR